MYVKPGETRAYRKKADLSARIMNEQAEIRLSKLNEAQLKEQEAKEKRDKMFSGMSRRKIRESRNFELDSFRVKNGVLSEMLVESFANVVYDSILINEETKINFKEKIYSDSKELMNMLMENNVVTLDTFAGNSSVTVREIFAICEEASEELVDEAKDTEEVTKKTEKFAKDKKKKNRQDKISKTVKDKVTNVIRREKEVAEANEEQNKIDLSEGVTYRKNESPSLFRAINIAASSGLLESTNSKLDMDLVFAESLIQYTLLETMNTMNLVKFDSKGVKKLISDYIH